jgi:anaerobic selenocysteine-containing dehydrogenase
VGGCQAGSDLGGCDTIVRHAGREDVSPVRGDVWVDTYDRRRPCDRYPRGRGRRALTRAHLPEGLALREIHEDPDRLRHPLRRTRSGWEKVSWHEALDEAAERIHQLQQRHGRDAVGMYTGNPSAHDYGAALSAPLFGALLRTKNRFDANSQDANPKLFASLRMFGELTSLTVPDVDRTDFFLILGANPAASNGSLMSLGDARRRIHGIRERGGRVVLVDPRRSETAAWADEHHPIRPGGDAALLAAMLHVVFAEGLGDDRRASEMATGISTLAAAVQTFSPERVAGAIGLDAAVVRDLARRFATARTAVAYGRIGLCQSLFGPVAIWLTEALNVITGNFDRPGGSMFTKPAVDITRVAQIVGLNGAGRFRSRVRNLPEVGGMLPAATMAEEMETDGPGQIRGLVTLAGNPVLSVPNGERLARAFAGLDFMVSIDLYVNETTRHARDPAAGVRARAEPLRRRVPHARRAQHGEMVAAGIRADNERATRLGHPLEPRVPDRWTSNRTRPRRARGAARDGDRAALPRRRARPHAAHRSIPPIAEKAARGRAWHRPRAARPDAPPSRPPPRPHGGPRAG